jgi:integrase
VPDVIEHLGQFTGTADDQLVFTGPKVPSYGEANFTRQWCRALDAAGMTGIHFPDLRRASCAFHRGAGDGNRTRTVSLGICAVPAGVRPHLQCKASASDRE